MAWYLVMWFNTLRPRHFIDNIFKCIFLNENAWILLRISLNFVPRVRINNIPSLVQIMAWCRPGDKPLSEPMMVSLLMHMCHSASMTQATNEAGHQNSSPSTEIAKTLGLTSIRYQSDTKVSDLYLMDVDLKVFAIWVMAARVTRSIPFNIEVTSWWASQITSLTIVYSNCLFRRRSKKTSKLRTLAFVQGIHRWPVNSPHKGPVMFEMFPFDDVIMKLCNKGLCSQALFVLASWRDQWLLSRSWSVHCPSWPLMFGLPQVYTASYIMKKSQLQYFP